MRKIWSHVLRTLLVIFALFDALTINFVDSKKYISSLPRHTKNSDLVNIPMCDPEYVAKYGHAYAPLSISKLSPSDFLSVERYSKEVFPSGNRSGASEFLKVDAKVGFLFDDSETEISGRYFDGSRKNLEVVDRNISSHEVARRRTMQNISAVSISKRQNSKIRTNSISTTEPPYYKASDTFSRMPGNYLNSNATNSTANRTQVKWFPGFCKSARRIIGGWLIKTIEQTPYMVFLDSGCGGAILSEQWIVTASHCITKIIPRYVYVGDRRLLGGCQHAIVDKHTHPFRKPKIFRYDIGLVKVAPKLVYSAAVKPIKIASRKAQFGACGIIAGWGTKKAGGVLASLAKMAIVPILLRIKCGITLKKSEFCAGYLDGSADTCQGDSGGPFVVNGVLVGITSRGRGCGERWSPGIYVDVWYYRNWIRRITGIKF